MPKIKQSVKKTGRARKELIVAELVERLDQSSGLVFTDYKGLTHKQLEDLKKELKKLDATIIIAKNSLLRLSLGKSQKYSDFKDNEGLDLPTATLFIKGDMVEPLKKLQKVIKDLGLPKIKFGVLEGSLTDELGVLKIASLPTREVLIAEFLWTLNAPIQGLVLTLNGTIQKFVMTLDAVAKAKPATPAPAEATPATQQPEPTESAPVATTPETPAIETATEAETPAINESSPAENADTTEEKPEEQNDNQNNEGGEEK